MKTIKAEAQGGTTWAIYVDGKFAENVENSGSSFDAAEDFLISRNEDIANYDVIETA